MKEKTIYELELHASIGAVSLGENNAETCWQIMRVAGGWIYTYWDADKQDYSNRGIFVPYNNEFDKSEMPYGRRTFD